MDRYRNATLIGQLEHFGDIVACEPVIRYVRALRPHDRIVFCTRQPYVPLVKHHPDVDEIITVGCLTEWSSLSQNSTGVFTDVIDLHVHGRVCPICRVPLQKRNGDPSVNVDRYYEFGNLLAAFCRGAGLVELRDTPKLALPAQAISRVSALNIPGPFVAIHKRSSEESRDWSDDKWEHLTTRLITERDLSVVFIDASAKLRTASGINDLGSLDLLESAALIGRATLFIGIDSGPAHLANATGTPGVILLGRYRRFDRYCPYSGDYADGSNATLVYQTDGPASLIEVDRVYDAVVSRLAMLKH